MAKDKAAARDDEPSGPSWRDGGDSPYEPAYCLGIGILEHLPALGNSIPLSFWAGVFAGMEHHPHEPALRRIAVLALDILDAESPPRRPWPKKRKGRTARKAGPQAR